MKTPCLYTERLKLRPIVIGDAIALWPYMSDPDVPRYMSWNPHTSIEQTEQFIQSLVEQVNQGKTICWVLEYQEQVSGLISIIDILRTHRALTYNRGELAYWLAPDKQKMGLMSEAGQCIIHYAFEELALHRLTVAHDVRNQASQGLIIRLGFRFLFQEHQSFKKNNQWVNSRYYELLRSEFQLRKANLSTEIKSKRELHE